MDHGLYEMCSLRSTDYEFQQGNKQRKWLANTSSTHPTESFQNQSSF